VQPTRLQSGGKFDRAPQVSGDRLHLISDKGSERKQFLLDFTMPDVLNNNIELMGVDLGAIDAIPATAISITGAACLASGANRGKMKAELPFYLGGEDAFCRRVARMPAAASRRSGR
jgi:7,8-dihydropterin-6-yl-methyl-4-(beta-D-ribofuranosyl)aminobenzene 5'-phosphate synthase